MGYVLVVDDDEIILNALSTYLEINGWTVATTTNGSKAISMAEKNKPELIITDISMPDMDGIELIRQLGKRVSDVPIIVMSGNPVGTRFLESAKMFGAKTSITKPFTFDELKSAMEQIIPEIDNSDE